MVWLPQLDFGSLRSDGTLSTAEMRPLVIWILCGTKGYPGLGFQIYRCVCVCVCVCVCTCVYILNVALTFSALVLQSKMRPPHKGASTYNLVI